MLGVVDILFTNHCIQRSLEQLKRLGGIVLVFVSSSKAVSGLFSDQLVQMTKTS